MGHKSLLMNLTLFGGYGLTIWYGSKLILEKGYTGGQVISIIVALVYGGMEVEHYSYGKISLVLHANSNQFFR